VVALIASENDLHALLRVAEIAIDFFRRQNHETQRTRSRTGRPGDGHGQQFISVSSFVCFVVNFLNRLPDA
jgi:hypothetical protein